MSSENMAGNGRPRPTTWDMWEGQDPDTLRKSLPRRKNPPVPVEETIARLCDALYEAKESILDICGDAATRRRADQAIAYIKTAETLMAKIRRDISGRHGVAAPAGNVSSGRPQTGGRKCKAESNTTQANCA